MPSPKARPVSQRALLGYPSSLSLERTTSYASTLTIKPLRNHYRNQYPSYLLISFSTAFSTAFLDRLNDSIVFLKLDRRNANRRIHTQEGDKWKTAFYTRYRHYKYHVMPFVTLTTLFSS